MGRAAVVTGESRGLAICERLKSDALRVAGAYCGDDEAATRRRQNLAITVLVAPAAPDILEAIKAQFPVGRLGRPEEIARGVAFLVDEAQGFITGSTLSANGGQYLALASVPAT
ncbi:SDR family oxidoreductase [Phenylobacterium immobile]|uniref:SDR family oxidoreductase n=1 Tax=Phenylobacterium immobile TaxID=21 RepID=UPI000ABBB034|nr:SDR family oxidoreductase [Phenylobacterium immobile]